MVSLSSFSEVTEEGVRFASPFTGEPTMLTVSRPNNAASGGNRQRKSF